MPGIVTHLLTGFVLNIIGRFYFKNYFDYNYKKQFFLLITCITFSILPDVFLGIYYTTHILPLNVLASYHRIAHIAFSPIAIVILLLWRSETERKIYWEMSLWAIILHLSMDLFIQETGPFF